MPNEGITASRGMRHRGPKTSVKSGHLAITPSCQKASGVTVVDRHLVSSLFRNPLEIQVMKA
jgi:hypothetical protein